MSLVVMRRKVQAKQNATKRNNKPPILYGDHLKCCGGGGLKNNVNNKNLSYHSLRRKKVKCETSSDKLKNVKRKYRVNSRLSSSEHLRLKLDRIMYRDRIDECNPTIKPEKSKCTVSMLPVHYTRHSDKCVVTKKLNLPTSYDLYKRVDNSDPCAEIVNANNPCGSSV